MTAPPPAIAQPVEHIIHDVRARAFGRAHINAHRVNANRDQRIPDNARRFKKDGDFHLNLNALGFLPRLARDPGGLPGCCLDFDRRFPMFPSITSRTIFSSSCERPMLNVEISPVSDIALL
jgi:hypothetical protein